MRYYRGKTRAIFLAIAVIAFNILFAASLRAQQGVPFRPGGISERDRNLLERETQLTMIEKDRQRAVKRDPQLAFAQIREDFRRLQILNNDVMRAVSTESEPNYKTISDSAREIRRRAARLKLNLVFPEAESREGLPRLTPSPGASDLKPSVEALDTLIFSFVTNPVFKETNVVDARLGVKARRDLEAIIELSEKVRKSAEKMSKSASK
ncbi:MAG TPA: hypothetical protein VF544_14315 [Pyrinomonadaceae bacterium]|jgi:hypothetical protein